MHKSAICSRYETQDYCSYEFDYQADFTQFLAEARKNVSQATSNITPLESTGKQQLNWEKKSRKSWRDSLFSWLKTDKKSKSIKQPTNGLVSKTRHGYVSGPVEATVGRVRAGRARGAASGPLVGLFDSTEEYEVPYMCLGQLNNHQKLQSYGPVYSVT